MKNYKKIVALLLAGAMTLSLVACGGNSKKSTEKKDDGEVVAGTSDAKSEDNDLVIAIGSNISSLDPHNIPDTMAIAATRGMYESLIKFDDEREITGQLAKSWEISDDSLTYTFKLNEGIKFQDGTDFNAAAVKGNFDRVFKKENNLRTRRTYIVTNDDETETPRIASIETPDDTTVVFKLTEPYSPFINKLTMFSIISPTTLDQYGNDIMFHPCGTGPYVFKEWVEGDHTTMTRNEEYWGEKASVDSVTIKEVPEAGSRTAMLQTGEADFVYPMPADQISAVEGNGDITVNAVTSNIMRYVTLNMDLPELKEQKVRQAMNYAIDKDAYIELMYAGYGVEATSTMPSVISYYSKQKPYNYDLDKAKKLMKEAGFEAGFKLTLWGENITQDVKGMTFVKQQLEKIGIEVEVVPMEQATIDDKIYVEKDQAEINMWYVNWSASSFDADGSMRALLYSKMCPPTSANTAYYNNSEFDKLMDDGLHTADPDKLAKIYADAQKIAWEDCPWLFLGNDKVVFASKSYLSGVNVAPDGAFNYADAKLAQ